MIDNPFEMNDAPVVSITKGVNSKKSDISFSEKKIKPEIKVDMTPDFSVDMNTGKVTIENQVVRQVIFGNIPSKSNCYKIITFKSKDPGKSHASLAKTKALTQYEKDFYIQCSKYRNSAIDEYFTLQVDVFYPSQRSDLDNCLKVLLDCLQKVNAITNDNKCVRIVANKFLDAKNPRIEFVIEKAM